MQTEWIILKMLAVQFFRYILFVGIPYLIICKWGAHFFEKYRIQKTEITKKQIAHEIKYSMFSILIFAVMFSVLFMPEFQKFSKIYLNVNDYPRWWLYGSLVYLTVFNDTYFYWLHRIIHHKSIYRLVHHTHHVSINPSPLASYSFHPIETVLEAAWIYPAVCLAPISLDAFVIYSIISLVNNVRGHLSVDLMPQKLRTIFPFDWINTSRHHSLHHKYYTRNYGLYFLFWDRWLKTDKLSDRATDPKTES